MAKQPQHEENAKFKSTQKHSLKPIAQKGKVHKAILEASQQLMLNRSLDGISIDEIVIQANVAKGSFYNHFMSKEVLASEIYKHVRLRASGLVEASLHKEMTAPERLITGAFVLVKFTVEHPESACALISLSPALLASSSPLNIQAKTIIQQGFCSGTFKNMPVESAVKLVIGMMLMMHQDSLGSNWPLKRILIKLSPLAQGLLNALGVSQQESIASVQQAITNVTCN